MFAHLCLQLRSSTASWYRAYFVSQRADALHWIVRWSWYWAWSCALLRFFSISIATMFAHLCLQLRSPSGAALCERLCVKVSVEASSSSSEIYQKNNQKHRTCLEDNGSREMLHLRALQRLRCESRVWAQRCWNLGRVRGGAQIKIDRSSRIAAVVKAANMPHLQHHGTDLCLEAACGSWKACVPSGTWNWVQLAQINL